MNSGDGLIVRLKISGGIVGISLAARLAKWSLRWGNGQIDLSGRGNLQLRGLAARNLDVLRDELVEWDLLDPSAAGEAVRNVVSSPLAGLDPGAVLDVRPIVRKLEQRLAADVALHDLPGKFGFVIDDGGQLGLDGLAADIRFTAHPGPRGPEFAVRVAGASFDLPGRCPPDALVGVAVALSRAFLDARRGRETTVRRMSDLVRTDGADAIGRAANIDRFVSFDARRRQADDRPSDHPHPGRSVVIFGVDPMGADEMRRGSSPYRHGRARSGHQSRLRAGVDGRVELGHDDGDDENDTGTVASLLGVGLPFGRVSAADFANLASATEAVGAREFRLTPWRVVLVPVPSVNAARALAASLAGTSFILDPHDPRCRVAACPGAPSCPSGTTSVRDDATILAARIPRGSGIVIHVSGCEKGCAHPREAAVTLVARAGRYDLVRDGLASGVPLATNLTGDQAIDQAIAILTPGVAA